MTWVPVARRTLSSGRKAPSQSIGVVDSDLFKGKDQVLALERETRETLRAHVDFAMKMGIPAQAAHRIGTDIVEEASQLCLELSKNIRGR